MIRDDINAALKAAMKANDERQVSTLRLVNSTLKNADIEARCQGKEPVGDDGVLAVLQKMIKQRKESTELYEKGGRAELARGEREEIAIISAYVPKQMSEAKVKAAIAEEIANTDAAGVKDMGKVIGELKGKYTGKTDFGKVSALAKQSSETAEQFIRRFLDTYERHDLDALWTFYGTDCRFPVLERFDIDPSWENYKAFMTRFIDAFPDIRHRIEKLVTNGESVWALYTMTGTHRGPLRGMQPTGRKVCYPIVAMYRISGGLIREADFVSDDLRMMRQIGALPS